MTIVSSPSMIRGINKGIPIWVRISVNYPSFIQYCCLMLNNSSYRSRSALYSNPPRITTDLLRSISCRVKFKFNKLYFILRELEFHNISHLEALLLSRTMTRFDIFLRFFRFNQRENVRYLEFKCFIALRRE